MVRQILFYILVGKFDIRMRGLRLEKQQLSAVQLPEKIASLSIMGGFPLNPSDYHSTLVLRGLRWSLIGLSQLISRRVNVSFSILAEKNDGKINLREILPMFHLLFVYSVKRECYYLYSLFIMLLFPYWGFPRCKF